MLRMLSSIKCTHAQAQAHMPCTHTQSSKTKQSSKQSSKTHSPYCPGDFGFCASFSHHRSLRGSVCVCACVRACVNRHTGSTMINQRHCTRDVFKKHTVNNIKRRVVTEPTFSLSFSLVSSSSLSLLLPLPASLCVCVCVRACVC